jgi:hypothetical protein
VAALEEKNADADLFSVPLAALVLEAAASPTTGKVWSPTTGKVSVIQMIVVLKIVFDKH